MTTTNFNDHPETEVLPGSRLEDGLLAEQFDVSVEQMRASTDRYWSREFQDLESRQLWAKVWQIACRADEVPDPGDWFEHRVADQSYLVVRGHDGTVRALVNACRHRGNKLCQDRGNSAVLTCPFHMWQFNLDGTLRSATDETTFCPFDHREYGLYEIRADIWGGWVFVNPDPAAAPLAQFLQPVAELLDPYHPEQMVASKPNVRQPLACNWKVVVEAFIETYHLHAVHPQVLPTNNDVDVRHTLLGDHNMFVLRVAEPSPRLGEVDTAEVVDVFLTMCAAFERDCSIENRAEKALALYRNAEGEVEFPPGVTLRSLFADVRRKQGAERGIDFSGLTDDQLTDTHEYLLFPNIILVMRAGEFLCISVTPDPDGDPNRCLWDLTAYRWIADPHERAAKRTQRRDVTEDTSLGLVLDQDREQMPRQQLGLRNRRLDHVMFSKQEIRAAHFNRTLERYLGLTSGPPAI